MGSSMSCPCPDTDPAKRKVLMMEENGEMIKLSHGTRAKDVLVAYPNRKLVQCSSTRSALPASTRLSCNRLYFLLPEDLDVTNETYARLLKTAASRGLKLPKPEGIDNGRMMPPEIDRDGGKAELVDDLVAFNISWKPSLHSISEVISPTSPTPSKCVI